MLAVAALQKTKCVKVYFWNGRSNFGDGLALSLGEYFGLKTSWCPPGDCELFSVGSILEKVPPGFDGVILGSGHIREDGPSGRLDRARVLAVRGPLTARKEKLKNVVMGDPGVLAPLLVKPSQTQGGKIGVVAHYVDEQNPILKEYLRRNDRAVSINVAESPAAVLAAIAECEIVLSSSLHGLVVADAYGIPASWIKLSENIYGGRFKFDDYHLAVGSRRQCLVIERGADFQRAEQAALGVDRDSVAQMRESLVVLYRKLPGELRRCRARRLVAKAGRFLARRRRCNSQS